MLLLAPRRQDQRMEHANPDKLIARLALQAAELGDPQERLPQRIYSRFVAHYLQHQSSPPINADEFYERLTLAELPG
jgi:hypothetical protein